MQIILAGHVHDCIVYKDDIKDAAESRLAHVTDDVFALGIDPFARGVPVPCS
jgi:hypothetical protein